MPDAVSVVGPLGFYCWISTSQVIQSYVLVSPDFCSISFLFLDLYVLGDI